MKATELMIEDWVLYDGEPYQIRQLGIYEVNRDGEDYPAVCVGKPKGIGLIIERNEIEPIPLTPEILEKNGFVKQDYDGWLIHEDNGRGLIEYRTDYFDGFLIINYIKKPFSKISVKLKHVHELQHALRLCGINKEITI